MRCASSWCVALATATAPRRHRLWLVCVYLRLILRELRSPRRIRCQLRARSICGRCVRKRQEKAEKNENIAHRGGPMHSHERQFYKHFWIFFFFEKKHKTFTQWKFHYAANGTISVFLTYNTNTSKDNIYVYTRSWVKRSAGWWGILSAFLISQTRA